MPSSTAARSCATRWSRVTRGIQDIPRMAFWSFMSCLVNLSNCRAADVVVGGLEQCAQPGDLAQICVDAGLAKSARGRLRVKLSSNAASWSSRCETANQADADTINPAMATTRLSQEYRARHQLRCGSPLGPFPLPIAAHVRHSLQYARRAGYRRRHVHSGIPKHSAVDRMWAFPWHRDIGHMA